MKEWLKKVLGITHFKQEVYCNLCHNWATIRTPKGKTIEGKNIVCKNCGNEDTVTHDLSRGGNWFLYIN